MIQLTTSKAGDIPVILALEGLTIQGLTAASPCRRKGETERVGVGRV